jgi:hypothetical protein
MRSPLRHVGAPTTSGNQSVCGQARQPSERVSLQCGTVFKLNNYDKIFHET